MMRSLLNEDFIMALVIATLVTLNGQAWAFSTDGSRRALTPPAELLAGETLIVAAGSTASIERSDGQQLSLQGEISLKISDTMSEATLDDATDAALADASVVEALRILAEGGDLLDDMEATAAGPASAPAPTAAGSDGNTSFVQLGRIEESTDPLRFTFDTAGDVVDTSLTWFGSGRSISGLDNIPDPIVPAPNPEPQPQPEPQPTVPDPQPTEPPVTPGQPTPQPPTPQPPTPQPPTPQPQNAPPTGDDLALFGVEDRPVNGTVVARDADGDALVFALATVPLHGKVTLDATTGDFTFIPDANFFGNDSFLVRVSDGKGGMHTQRVDISIAPVNDAPTTADLVLTTDEEVAVTGQVSGIDLDGDTLTFVITQRPANGVVSLDPLTGQFTYTPLAQFHGADQFHVVVDDGKGGTAYSIVDITVNHVVPPNQVPVADDDKLVMWEGESIAISVLTNDTDADQDSLSIVGLTNPQHGSVIVDTQTGLPVYTPTAGFVGSDQFTYTISDGKGGTAVGTVIIDVKAALTPDEKAVLEDQIFTDNVLSNDPAPGLSLVGFTVNNTNYNVGDKASITGIGDIVFQSTGVYTFTPAPHYFGAVPVITYVTNKGYSSTLTLTVDAVNDAPVGVDDLGFVTRENQPLQIAMADLLKNDTDIDDVQLSIGGLLSVNNGSVVIDGDYIYFTPTQGFIGVATFIYNVVDPSGAAGQATVSISVEKPNLAPDAVNDADLLLINAGYVDGMSYGWASPMIAALSAQGGTVAARNADAVTGAIGVAGSGLTNEKDDEIQWGESLSIDFVAPVYNASFGIDRLDFVTDKGPERGIWIAHLNGIEVGRGEFVSQNATRISSVEVKDSQGQPIAFDRLTFGVPLVGYDYVVTWLKAAHSPMAVVEGEAITRASADGVLANDTDPENDTLAVVSLRTGSASEQGIQGVIGQSLEGQFGSLTLQADGGYTFSAKDTALAAGQLATQAFTYTVSDGKGNVDTATLEFTVIGAAVNDTGLLHVNATRADEVLSGSVGADVFTWTLSDIGSTNTPAIDIVANFSVSAGDRLNLQDLLQDRGAADVSDYLHVVYNAARSETQVHVSSQGGYSNGYTANATDQIIQLSGVTLSGDSDAMLAQLKASGALITD
jgi:VCBS repeat-containing protein